MALTPGTRLGPYEINAQIGVGGMGEVYRARDTRLDRIVAIKVLPEALAADPQFRDRFEREARAISSLNHPHICTLYDVGHQDGTNYMAPEQAEGRPLDARADVFSFGAVLYEMVSGSRAFGGSSVAQVLSAVLRDDPRPFEAPPALARVVTRCLAKQPGQRFQTMADVRAALEHASQKSSDAEPSIAVLPFENLNHHPASDYFADGLTDELIRNLFVIEGLAVRSRTSSFVYRMRGRFLAVFFAAFRAISSPGVILSGISHTTMWQSQKLPTASNVNEQVTYQ